MHYVRSGFFFFFLKERNIFVIVKKMYNILHCLKKNIVLYISLSRKYSIVERVFRFKRNPLNLCCHFSVAPSNFSTIAPLMYPIRLSPSPITRLGLKMFIPNFYVDSSYVFLLPSPKVPKYLLYLFTICFQEILLLTLNGSKYLLLINMIK